MSSDPEVAALASPAARAAAAIGLAAGWVLIGVPSTILASLVTSGLLAGDVAALIDSRVDPTTVDVEAALVVALIAAILGNGVALTRQRAWGWRSAVVAIGKVFLFCTALAVPSLLQGWSQPALRVAALFAWCIQVNVLVTLGVIAGGAWLAGALWRASRRHSAAAVMVGLGVGASSAVSGLLFLVVLAVAAQPAANTDESWGEEAGSLGQLIVHLAEDAREQARAERLAVQAELRSPFAALFALREAYASDDTAAGNRCLEALATRKDGEPDSKIDQAGRYLRLRGGFAFEDARDLAVDKALAVCLRARLSDAEAARAYYWRSIENARVDTFRSRRAALTCSLTPGRERKLRAPDVMEDQLELWRERCLDQARCRLSGPDRSLLSLCVEFSLRELEARGIATRSDAQRKCSKVKEKVRRTYTKICADDDG